MSAPGEVLAEFRGSGGAWVRVVKGDITLERVDAIVNAANGRLEHGGGVAGAIARRGGASIREESRAWVARHGEVPTGRAAVTGAGDLMARYVIHAVGPVWGAGDEDALLESAVRSALDLARERGLASVSLPAISSGIFGFPKERCAEILLRTADAYEGLAEIRLCNFDEETASIFECAARPFRRR